ncbi:MAG: hypothetical protein M0031_13315 [Thermaerobacter sp.]|nr:hypothetical protein [Thermaerobacter sp.]
MQATYQAKIPDKGSYPLLDAIAAAKKAVRKAVRDLAKLRSAKVSAAQAASMRHRLRFTLHQKRRRLHALERRLAVAQADHEAGRVRLCFGGKKLFHAQFHLKANGFADLAAWQAAWRKRRSSQFLCLGSKDESAGNQTCTRLPDGSLRLRVPPGLEAAFGKHVLVKDVKFTYGQAVDGCPTQHGRRLGADLPEVACRIRMRPGGQGVEFRPGQDLLIGEWAAPFLPGVLAPPHDVGFLLAEDARVLQEEIRVEAHGPVPALDGGEEGVTLAGIGRGPDLELHGAGHRDTSRHAAHLLDTDDALRGIIYRHGPPVKRCNHGQISGNKGLPGPHPTGVPSGSGVGVRRAVPGGASAPRMPSVSRTATAAAGVKCPPGSYPTGSPPL